MDYRSEYDRLFELIHLLFMFGIQYRRRPREMIGGGGGGGGCEIKSPSDIAADLLAVMSIFSDTPSSETRLAFVNVLNELLDSLSTQNQLYLLKEYLYSNAILLGEPVSDDKMLEDLRVFLGKTHK